MSIRKVLAVLAIVGACTCAAPLLATDNQDPNWCWDPDWGWLLCTGGGGSICYNPKCAVGTTDPVTGVTSCDYLPRSGACVCLASGPHGTCSQ